MSYASEVLADSPLAYWKLNDASGNFADSSGNNLPLTPAGTVTYGQPGPISGDAAVEFGSGGTGTRSVISTAVDNISMEAWVYPTARSADSAFIANQKAGAGYEVALNSNGKVTVTCQNVAVIGGAGSVIPLNTWTYIVVTRATTWKSYVNGLIDQASMGTTTAFTPFAATTSIANTVFTGRIGQAAFYTSPLSASRIAAHFAAASTDVLLPMSVTPVFVGG